MTDAPPFRRRPGPGVSRKSAEPDEIPQQPHPGADAGPLRAAVALLMNGMGVTGVLGRAEAIAGVVDAHIALLLANARQASRRAVRELAIFYGSRLPQ